MLHVSSADIYGSSNKTGDTILTTTNAYDKSGNLSKTIEPDSTVTTYTYDNMNRLLTKTQDTLDENGARTTATIEVMGYTWNGKEIKTKDALGNITEYAYDQKGRLIKTKKTTTDHSNTVTSFKPILRSVFCIVILLVFSNNPADMPETVFAISFI
jgi:YD repeat-containing protein